MGKDYIPGYTDYTIKFTMHAGGLSKELVELDLLEYLEECVKNKDVSAFKFVEDEK